MTHAVSPRAAAIAAALLAAPVLPAAAHVTATPNEAAAGGYARFVLTVGHGCKGAATVALRVKIPEGLTSVKPQMKPGWTVTITRRPLAQPVDNGHGGRITETVDTIEWRGGPLPDELYDQFGLSAKLPDEPGRTLWFPTVQECVEGVHRWIAIPTGTQTWGELNEPAPFLKLVPKAP